jgi:unsaturated rhamnogalacturonyl hydrolase
MNGKSIFMTGIGLFCMISLAAPCAGRAPNLPDKKQIVEKMELANGYFMNKWPDPGKDIITDRRRPSNIWTRAVYYEGLLALYQIDPKPEYLDYAVRWGEYHKWGLRDGISTRNADNQCCGQAYIDLFLMDEKPERIKDIKASMDSMVNSPKIDDWSWIDALQMAMPVFARLGVIYKDTVYFKKMYDMYMFTKAFHGTNGLYSLKDHLWWRDKDFVPPYQEPNGKNCYWSRGNGWVFAALVRVLDILPPDAPHREEYLRTFKEMARALAAVQRTDGYWNVSLHDSTHFGGKELTGTALITYGMAWGIKHEHLKKGKYLPIAVKAWNAMAAHSVHPNGFLGFVQGTGKEPKDSQPVGYDREPNHDDFGVGCFLLAGSAMYAL